MGEPLDLPERATPPAGESTLSLAAPKGGSRVPVRTGPGLFGLLARKLGLGRQGKEVRHRLVEEWNIGVLNRPIESLLDEDPNRDVRWLPAPAKGGSRSMPFGWHHQGQLHVVYRRTEGSGSPSAIARIRPKPEGTLKRSRMLLEGEEPYSYPCVVEHADEILMVPEQCALGRVDLYRFDEATSELVLLRTLLDLPLASPTLFRYQGTWWLMGTSAGRADSELLAFHASTLEGPFMPHAMNPLKTDVHSARPGGTPFMVRNHLWRPVQDLGGEHPRVRINRIVALTPELFAEEESPVLKAMAGAWCGGMRTLSQVGAITLVDGLRHAPRPKRHGPIGHLLPNGRLRK